MLVKRSLLDRRFGLVIGLSGEFVVLGSWWFWGIFGKLNQWKDIVIMGMLLSKYRYENVFFFLNLKLFYVLV